MSLLPVLKVLMVLMFCRDHLDPPRLILKRPYGRGMKRKPCLGSHQMRNPVKSQWKQSRTSLVYRVVWDTTLCMLVE